MQDPVVESAEAHQRFCEGTLMRIGIALRQRTQDLDGAVQRQAARSDIFQPAVEQSDVVERRGKEGIGCRIGLPTS